MSVKRIYSHCEYSATVPAPSPATFGLLGLLATRPWTGYQLTQQVRRSLRFVWPASEGHLYREQNHLVTLGWATVTEEPVGRRTRKLYEITEQGRDALAHWLTTEPEEPHLQIEGVLRAFYCDRGSAEDLANTADVTAAAARAMVAELSSIAEEYLQPSGPMEMLERGEGLQHEERQEFNGREVHPERLPAVALAMDVTSELLTVVDRYFSEVADRAASWPATSGPALAAEARERLERTLARSNHGATDRAAL